MNVKEFLKENIGLVTFNKTDGTVRIMRCTLNSELIDQYATPYERKTNRVATINEDVLRVFDLDKLAWRSFRLDSVTDVDAA